MTRKMPVILTFDVDGETLWLCRDPENAKRPVTLSQGRYGPEEGVPRIMRLLEKYGIRATFFIPGMTVSRYPDLVRNLALAGHEIGNHGWSHTYPDNMDSYDTEKKEYFDCSNIIEKITGTRPRGYRSPAWEFSVHTLDILAEMPEIEYSSNMMDTERIRYLSTGDRKTNLVELPIHWVLDDAAYWLYSVRTPGKSMQPLESVEFYWRTEFDALLGEFREEAAALGNSDICFILTCHPQIIGRPARMAMLDRFVGHIAATDGVEFLTGIEAASGYRAGHPNPKNGGKHEQF
ncbi:polysaccharide deacetylase [Spirochaetia bacterium]|nr:polysaccharide deacetylase [Spirochaetia bacterium]